MTQLIPNGKQQFVDLNGRPLVGGKVYFYSVGTSTPKNTYQDIGETILNTNPVILDARGQASIYGTGNYRQVVRDLFGVQIWDQTIPDAANSAISALTADLANFTDPAKGSGMVAYLSKLGAAVGRWLTDKLAERVSIFDYMTAAEIADANSAAPVLNHSAAFVNMFAAMVANGVKRAYINPVKGYYNVGGVAVPLGVGLYGHSAPPYTAFNVADVLGAGSTIVMLSGASSMFTWTGRHTVDGVILHGRDRTQDAFKATAGQISGLRLFRCGIYRFARGVGNNSYVAGSTVIDCSISGNSNGISNTIDSRVIGGVVNANENVGIQCLTGANDNSFVGVKCEWNNSHNWEFFGSANNVVNGGITDRAGAHNFKVGSGSQVVIGSVVSRRAGRSTTGYNFFVESAIKASISNALTAHGADDGGGGTDSPSTCVYIRGINGQVTLTNVDMTGSTSLPLNIEGGSTFDYFVVRDCNGAKDTFNRPGDLVTSTSVAALTTVNVPVTLPVTSTFGRTLYRVSITARNTATGGTILGGIVFGIQRESGSATATAAILDWATANFGVAGTETISLSVVNVAADGSTADIAVKSTHATQTHAVNVVLSRIL